MLRYLTHLTHLALPITHESGIYVSSIGTSHRIYSVGMIDIGGELCGALLYFVSLS